MRNKRTPNPSKKFLIFLSKYKGKEISYQKIEEFRIRLEYKKQRKSVQSSKTRKHRTARPADHLNTLSKQELEQILSKLQELGTVQKEKKQVTVSSSFLEIEGTCSLSPYGNVYVQTRNKAAGTKGIEVYVPSHKRATALDGDKVRVQIEAYSRKTRNPKDAFFSAKILSVQERGRSLYRIQVIENPLNNSQSIESHTQGAQYTQSSAHSTKLRTNTSYTQKTRNPKKNNIPYIRGRFLDMNAPAIACIDPQEIKVKLGASALGEVQNNSVLIVSLQDSKDISNSEDWSAPFAQAKESGRYLQAELNTPTPILTRFVDIEASKNNQKSEKIDSSLERILMKYNLKKDNYPYSTDEEQTQSFQYFRERTQSARKEAQKLASNSMHLADSKKLSSKIASKLSLKTSPKAKKHQKKRIDLRELYTLTIDGDHAKDFDDALSLILLAKKKQCLLYVHIADVSFYVRKGDSIDQKAQELGTSHYLAQHVIPMLPKILSEDFCSLIARQERLSVTVEMRICLETGKIEEAQFYRSLIQVDRRFTYSEVEHILTEKEAACQKTKAQEAWPSKDDEKSMLFKLWKLSQALGKRRSQSGRIELTIAESIFHYNTEGNIQNTSIQQGSLKSQKLIEECMLSANICTAEFLGKKKTPLYRNHPALEVEKLKLLNGFLNKFSPHLRFRNNQQASVQKVITALRQFHESKGNDRSIHIPYIFSILLLRSFSQAYYSPENKAHWGLGFMDYCHFTSPIRRYPDLLNHRQLLNALGIEQENYSSNELKNLGHTCSELERKSLNAQRDIRKLKALSYLEKQQKPSFIAILSSIDSSCVFLNLKEIPSVEVVILAEELLQDPFIKMAASQEKQKRSRKSSQSSLRKTEPSVLDTSEPFKTYIPLWKRSICLGEEWEIQIDKIQEEEIKIFCKPTERFFKQKGMRKALKLKHMQNKA